MEKKETIGNVTAGAIIATAIVIDGLQFLLTLTVVGSVVATFVTFAAGFGFWLWFALLGVKYSGKAGGKKALTGLASVIAEFIPFVNALPATTLGVTLIILQTKADDRSRVAGGADPKKAAAQARLGRMRAARDQRVNALREQRQETQAERHAANDNRPEDAQRAA